MDEMASLDNGQMYVEDSPEVDKAGDVDSERSPQLNKVICRCRCGCACAFSRDGTEMDSRGGGQRVDTTHFLPCTTGNAESDDGRSEEDLDDYEIEVGDFGLVSIRVIHSALAKQRRCKCHGSVLSESEIYTFSTCSPFEGSGFLSDDSLLVERGSGDERSVTMSTSSLGYAARSTSPSDIVPFMGGPFEFDLAHPIPHNHFTRTPILLGHEAEFFSNMQIGMEYHLHFPEDFTIEDSASSWHSEYDIW